MWDFYCKEFCARGCSYIHNPNPNINASNIKILALTVLPILMHNRISLSFSKMSFIVLDKLEIDIGSTVCACLVFQLSKDSYPLCMQNLHQNLRQFHHLKHWGRQQYGLFLKGIGLSLEEALRFWRMEFTRIMDGDKVVLLTISAAFIFHKNFASSSSSQMYFGFASEFFVSCSWDLKILQDC